MLRYYSLLNVDQVLLLFKAHRKEALAHNHHNDSRHLYHLKKFLANQGKTDFLAYYNSIVDYLNNAYIYDDDYNKRALADKFNMYKYDSKDIKTKSLRIIRHIKLYGKAVPDSSTFDTKILKKAKKPAYTPHITKAEVTDMIRTDNHNAKLLFKKYYHNDFKKANKANGMIDHVSYSLAKQNVKFFRTAVATDHKNIASLNKIISNIESVAEQNPKLFSTIKVDAVDDTPLEIYKHILSDVKTSLHLNKSNLEYNQKLAPDTLLCDSHIANPYDVEESVHMYNDRLTLDADVHDDLANIKNN